MIHCGMGVFNSTCCQFNNPLWFCVALSQSTTDDKTMTLLLNEGPTNDVFITKVEQPCYQQELCSSEILKYILPLLW